MNKELEINAEIGLCTKEMAHENPLKDFEILVEEYKDKWSKQMYDYFKECVEVLREHEIVYKEFVKVMTDYGLEDYTKPGVTDDEDEHCIENFWEIIRYPDNRINIGEQKALEIIKNKGVDVSAVIQIATIGKSHITYNNHLEKYKGVGDLVNQHRKPIDKEEYDLLKEMLL